MRDDISRHGRRKALQILGSGALATTGVSGVVAGKSNEKGFKTIIKESHQYRERVDDDDKWVEYLNDRGVEGSYQSYRIRVPEQDDGTGVGTNEYLQSEVELQMGIFADPYSSAYYVEQWWSYDDSWETAKGEYPLDQVGLAYDRNWWDWESDDVSELTETSTYVEPNVTAGTFDGTGPGYDVKDRAAWKNGDAGNRHYAGIHLLPTGSDDNTRRVYGAYVHNYTGYPEDFDVTVSLNVGVVEVSVSDGSSWKAREDINGDLMVVRESEA